MLLAPTLSLSAGSGAAIARPTFSRDFAGEKTLNNGTGPAITFTRASNATFFDASGTLQTAANDTPRFDHDPATGASRGLLIEESRTNSIRNSQAGGSTNGVIGSGGALPTNMSGGATANGVSTQVMGSGTENGLSYVDYKISGTPAANGTMFLNFEQSGQIAVSSGQTWTESVYVKLALGSVTNATVGINLGSRTSAGVPTGDGTLVNFTPTSASLATQRRTVTRTYNDATTAFAFPDVRVVYTNGNPIDLTLRIAAPQLEQGAFATSYIPTTSAAATRSADSAVVTPISSFYNQSEGTLFAEAREGGSDLQYGAVSLDTDTSDNRIDLRRNNDAGVLAMLVTTAGALQMLQSPVLAVAAQTYKLSGAYKVNDCAVCVNGGAVATDASVTLPTLTHLRIGGLTLVSPATGNSFPLNGHIRKIAYWPRRLSNSLLQQLTT